MQPCFRSLNKIISTYQYIGPKKLTHTFQIKLIFGLKNRAQIYSCSSSVIFCDWNPWNWFALANCSFDLSASSLEMSLLFCWAEFLLFSLSADVYCNIFYLGNNEETLTSYPHFRTFSWLSAWDRCSVAASNLQMQPIIITKIPIHSRIQDVDSIVTTWAIY